MLVYTAKLFLQDSEAVITVETDVVFQLSVVVILYVDD